jgi:hypothetical protein
VSVEKYPKGGALGIDSFSSPPSRIAAGNPFLIEINLRKFAFKREHEKIPYKAEPWGLILLAPPLKDRRRQSVLDRNKSSKICFQKRARKNTLQGGALGIDSFSSPP